MDYRSLHGRTVAELRLLAKELGVKLPSGVKKEEMIARLLEREASEEQKNAVSEAGGTTVRKAAERSSEKAQPKTAEEQGSKQASAQAEKTPDAERQAGENRIYRRSMSTQQRMGARTQPAQGLYRPQPVRAGRMPNRFVTDGGQRPLRSGDGRQRIYEPKAERRDPEASVPESRTAELREQSTAETLPDMRSVEAKPAERRIGGAENRMFPQTEDADESRAVNPAVPELLAAGDCGDGAGILEIHQDGYGFLRADNYLPGNRDVYVSAAQIRRFNLRTGDYVVGKTRAQQSGDRSVGLIYISEVNGQQPDMARNRRPFDSLIPVYPDQRLRMECEDRKEISLRLIDLIAPIGKGQRGMIVSPPKTGKTTLLKKIANAITTNNPDVHLIVLLIDERPEEVTDMKRSIQGEVVYSTFDEAPENHTRVSEMVLERAQRLVEMGKDVVILLDSITRLARAYNLVIPPTGRSLSGGLDPGALYKPKRFFGAARNIENGGSLTVIATALVDTGSRMDDIIFEEFKGTGNMELHLDRSLSDRRIFPAIDLNRSGTRREELLLSRSELECAFRMRRMLSGNSAQEAAEDLISAMERSRNNEEFCQRIRNDANYGRDSRGSRCADPDNGFTFRK